MPNSRRVLLCLLGATGAAALLTLLTGCVSAQAVRDRETLLVSAGFRAIPAVSSEQQWLVRSLPADQISVVSRMGKLYLVYPDRERLMLYVGHNAEYLAYEQKARARGLESSAWDSAWGDWDAR